MSTTDAEDVLVALAIGLRSRRSQLPLEAPWYVHDELVGGRRFAQAWFISRGCTWDRRGECAMCSYGHSSADEDLLVRSALAAIEHAGEVDELYISPSGNFLDPREVPRRARDRILRAAAATTASHVSFETRPETIDDRALGAVGRLLPGKQVHVGLGLESSDPWVRARCLAKSGGPASVAEAIERLAAHGFGAYANVTVGAPFLDAREVVDDGVASAQWAFEAGASQIILFPAHVKRHTVLEYLASRGRYAPPSLWRIVDILVALPGEVAARSQVAWHRALPDAVDVVASPDGCARCRKWLTEGLDVFRAGGSMTAVRDLDQRSCDCRAIVADPEPDRTERLARELASIRLYLDRMDQLKVRG